MSTQDDVTAAFGQLQSVFGKTATIQGVDGVGVTTGPNLKLAKGYGDGGVTSLQSVELYYSIWNNPAPVVDGEVVFAGRIFRIEAINQHQATWEITAVQIPAQA